MWQNNAAKVLDYNGGINLDEKGHYYYTDKDAINALANGSNQKKLFGEQTSVKIIPQQKRIIFHLRYSVTVV